MHRHDFVEMGRMDKVRLMRYRRSSRVNVYELQEFRIIIMAIWCLAPVI